MAETGDAGARAHAWRACLTYRLWSGQTLPWTGLGSTAAAVWLPQDRGGVSEPPTFAGLAALARETGRPILESKDTVTRLNVYLYDDRLDCFLGSARLLTLRRSDAKERYRRPAAG